MNASLKTLGLVAIAAAMLLATIGAASAYVYYPYGYYYSAGGYPAYDGHAYYAYGPGGWSYYNVPTAYYGYTNYLYPTYGYYNSYNYNYYNYGHNYYNYGYGGYAYPGYYYRGYGTYPTYYRPYYYSYWPYTYRVYQSWY